MKNPNHNLVHKLNEKLDSIWRTDQYIEDAEDDSCREIYRKMKEAEMEQIEALRKEIEVHVQEGRFD